MTTSERESFDLMLEVASLLEVEIHPAPVSLPDDTSGADVFRRFFCQGEHYNL